MTPDEIVRLLHPLATAVPDDAVFGAIARSLLISVKPAAGLSPSAISTTVAVPPPVVVGEVEIPKGQICECTECKKKVYELVDDVRANMKISAFIACFKPINGAASMTTSTDIWGDPYGNAAVDCPFCKGAKTVWIKGKGDIPFNEYPEGSK